MAGADSGAPLRRTGDRRPWYAPMPPIRYVLRRRYAMSYAADTLRPTPPLRCALCRRYAMSNAANTACPVLTPRMVLPGGSGAIFKGQVVAAWLLKIAEYGPAYDATCAVRAGEVISAYAPATRCP
eukprot:2952971-Rhodomonas_salina.2